MAGNQTNDCSVQRANLQSWHTFREGKSNHPPTPPYEKSNCIAEPVRKKKTRLCLALCCCQSQRLCGSQGVWHCSFSLTGSTYNSLAARAESEKDLIRLGFFPLSFFLIPFIGRGSKALNKQLRKRPIR